MQQIQSGAELLSGQILPLPIVILASCRTHHNGYANINGLTPSTQLAALDLGSNSFHLLIAQENQGRIHVIDKYKEMVRLGEGLVAGGQLSKEVSDRALQCLTRIAQRIRPIAKENLRIVGTNTLRQISSHSTFVFQAEEILGHPIEIISGREEARLIYLGVSHDLGDNASRQLVIDIGGGSTELIVGEQFSPIMLESLHMGCVSMTRKHFSAGLDLTLAFEQAINDALIELEPVANSYLTAGWQQVIGASGTVNSVISVQMAMGLGTQISSETLRSIQHQILQRNGTDGLPGLPEERVAVFAGGLAILIAIFATFTPQSVEASQSALREGVLHDLIGRKRDFDIRDQTVSVFASDLPWISSRRVVLKKPPSPSSPRPLMTGNPSRRLSAGCSRGLRICTKSVWISRITPTTNMAAICCPTWICQDFPAPSRHTLHHLSACTDASSTLLCWSEILIGWSSWGCCCVLLL